MIVRILDHPRLDLRLLVEHLGLHPCPRLGKALGQGERAPVLAVYQPADTLLQVAIGERFLLADQEHAIIGQFVAVVDGARESLDQIVLVQIGLARVQIAAEQIGGREPLEDAGDLLGDESGSAVLVIDAGEAKSHGPDRAAMFGDYRLGLGLRLGVGPGGFQRIILVDPRTLGRTGCLHQQRACIDELFGGKAPQRLQKPARALDIDGIVFGVVLAGGVVIGGKMNDGSKAPAATLTRRPDRLSHAFVGGDVEFDRLFGLGLAFGRTVEPDDAIPVAHAMRDRLAQETARAGNENGRLICIFRHAEANRAPAGRFQTGLKRKNYAPVRATTGT